MRIEPVQRRASAQFEHLNGRLGPASRVLKLCSLSRWAQPIRIQQQGKELGGGGIIETLVSLPQTR